MKGKEATRAGMGTEPCWGQGLRVGESQPVGIPRRPLPGCCSFKDRTIPTVNTRAAMAVPASAHLIGLSEHPFLQAMMTVAGKHLPTPAA